MHATWRSWRKDEYKRLKYFNNKRLIFWFGCECETCSANRMENMVKVLHYLALRTYLQYNAHRNVESDHIIIWHNDMIKQRMILFRLRTFYGIKSQNFFELKASFDLWIVCLIYLIVIVIPKYREFVNHFNTLGLQKSFAPFK